MGYAMWCAGAVVAFNGWMIEVKADTAFQQIYAGEYVLAGVLVVALGCVVNAVDAGRRQTKAIAEILKVAEDARRSEARSNG